MQFNRAVNRLLNILEEGVYDPYIFKAIFMTGPMGAGKSTVAQKLVGGYGLRSLNLDNFNEMAIKKGQVPNGQLSNDQLQKSWELVQAQKGNFIDGRLGLLIDGSGRNLQDISQNLTNLRNLGYDTACILVNVDVEVSIQRAQQRAAAQAQQYGQGRNVPEELQRSTHAAIRNNIPQLKKIFGKYFFEVDNTSQPVLTSLQKGVNSFLRTPPSSPAAIQWIQSEKQKRNTATVQ